jgi:hypothetical protein
MREIADRATKLALNEEEQGRSVVILFPTWSGWGRELRHMDYLPDGVYVRFSYMHSTLKALRVDTLIVALPEKCDSLGLAMAREMARLSPGPQYIYLEEDKA